MIKLMYVRVSKGAASAIFYTFGIVLPAENKKSRRSLEACVIVQKNHSLDVNNQNLDQMYMVKLEKFKRKHVVCKNTYNERDKQPQFQFQKLTLVELEPSTTE